jgi:hypothetical protein
MIEPRIAGAKPGIDGIANRVVAPEGRRPQARRADDDC